MLRKTFVDMNHEFLSQLTSNRELANSVHAESNFQLVLNQGFPTDIWFSRMGCALPEGPSFLLLMSAVLIVASDEFQAC